MIVTRLPRWLRPDHPLVQPAIALGSRHHQLLQIVLLVGLAGLGLWTARAGPHIPRIVTFLIPLAALSLVLRIAITAAVGYTIDRALAYGTWDQVRVTTMGTDEALLAICAAGIYRMRNLLAVSVLARLALVAVFVAELRRWPQDALRFVFLEAEPQLPWSVVAVLLGLGALAALLHPLGDAALSAAVGTLSARANERHIRLTITSGAVLLRLAPWALVTGLAIAVARVAPDYAAYGPTDFARFLLALAVATEGMFGLAPATVAGAGYAIARLDWGVLIGPAALTVVLGLFVLARALVRFAAAGFGAVPEVRIRWRTASVVAVGAALAPVVAGLWIVRPMSSLALCAQPLTKAIGRDLPPTTLPVITPVWSPDGKQMVYRANVDGNNDIFAVDADGRNERNLTAHPASERLPVWSPDGGSVVFQRQGGNSWEAVHLVLNSGQETSLANGLGHSWNPAWSPDGNWIAFLRKDDLNLGIGEELLAYLRTDNTNQEIYVARIDGSELYNISNRPEPDWSPVWSPDSENLAYETTQGNRRVIQVVSVHSWSQSKAVTIDHLVTVWHPVWAPDSHRLAFQSSDNVGGSAVSGRLDIDIFVLDSGTGEMRSLTFHPDMDTNPQWSKTGGLISFDRFNRQSGGSQMVVDAFGIAPPRPLPDCDQISAS